MSTEIIIDIIKISITALLVLIPTLIRIFQLGKKVKNANSNTEKEQAKIQLRSEAIELIKAAEIAYKDINLILKQKGSSAGPIKKDSVMTKLENYAVEKNIPFDREYWNSEVDIIVADSKEIN